MAGLIEDGDDENDQDDEEADEVYERGYESDEDDSIEEPHGIKGMTL